MSILCKLPEALSFIEMLHKIGEILKSSYNGFLKELNQLKRVIKPKLT